MEGYESATELPGSAPFITLSRRTLCWIVLALVATLPLFLGLSDRTAPTAALKLVASSIGVGIVPGLSLLLLMRRQSTVALFEVVGLGMAVSFSLVQLLTVMSIIGHIWSWTLAVGLWVACLVCLLLAGLLASKDSTVTLSSGELLIGALLAILCGLLYIQGSPFSYEGGEDAIHIAVIRRLVTVKVPKLDNIYWAPGIVYTYPFPATHFLFALVSLGSGLDPLFVYLKIRFLWAIGAILFLYLGARLVYGSGRLPFLVTIVGLIFAYNGTFASVPGFSWGQLVPFSHASDVAMSVFLPGLMVLGMSFLASRSLSDDVFFFIASMSVVLLLTIVHIREIVQFLVYLMAYFIALLVVKRERNLLVRTAILLVATVGTVFAYLHWHRHAVGHIDAFVQDRKEMLVEYAKALPLSGWFEKAFDNPYFVFLIPSFWLLWFAVIVLASPILLCVYRRQPFMLLAGSSTLAYLLIVRLPFIAIPYVYLTYFEILFTPVRNVVFFVHLYTGALFYVIAVALAGIPGSENPKKRTLLVRGGTLLAIAFFAGLFRLSGLLFDKHFDLYFIPAIGLHVVAYAACWSGRFEGWFDRLAPAEPLPKEWASIFCVMVGACAILTATPSSSPLMVSLAASKNTPLTCLELPTADDKDIKFPYNPGDPERRTEHPDVKVPRALSVAPPAELIEWSTAHLSTDATLAVNLLNKYSSAPFMPQHIAYWPHLGPVTGMYFRRIFPKYYDLLDKSLEKYKCQPFFNTSETLEERLNYVHELGITHILVDPMYHDDLVRVLGKWPQHFRKEYDAGNWAILKVIEPGHDQN